MSPAARATRDPRRAALPLVALLAVAAYLHRAGGDLPVDPDFFWHLRVADQLARDGVGPLVDQLSLNAQRAPWTPYSWLAELAMAAWWHLAGPRGYALLQGALAGAFALLLWATAREARRALRGDDDPFAPIAATFAGLLVALPFVSLRPVALCLVALAAAAWLWWRNERRGATRAVWLVVPLVALAANLHLYAGLLVAALWVPAVARRGRRDVVLALCSSLALLATPMLPGALATARFYGAADPMVARGAIAEMRPVWASAGPPGAIAAGVLVLLVARAARRATWRVVPVIGALVLTLWLGRFATLFALAAVPIACAAMPRFYSRAWASPPARVAVIVLLALGVVHAARALPARGESLDALAAAEYPAGACAFVDAFVPRARGATVNEFTWGGYLGWRLDRPVWMDGRTQVHAPAFWEAAYLGDELSRTRALARAHEVADCAVLPAGKSRYIGPLRALGWREAYRDGVAVVMLPPADVGAASAAVRTDPISDGG